DLQIFEPARLDENIAFERADGAVVRVEARFQPGPYVVEMRSEDTDRVVEAAPQLADSLGVLGLRLLLPAGRNGLQERNQRRRAAAADRCRLPPRSSAAPRSRSAPPCRRARRRV